MNELFAYWEKVRQDLNQTEIEQRLLEGDGSDPVYIFTIGDAIESMIRGDWGADRNAADSNRNLCELPVLRKAA